jgi:hypothetical protein
MFPPRSYWFRIFRLTMITILLMCSVPPIGKSQPSTTDPVGDFSCVGGTACNGLKGFEELRLNGDCLDFTTNLSLAADEIYITNLQGMPMQVTLVPRFRTTVLENDTLTWEYVNPIPNAHLPTAVSRPLAAHQTLGPLGCDAFVEDAVPVTYHVVWEATANWGTGGNNGGNGPQGCGNGDDTCCPPLTQKLSKGYPPSANHSPVATGYYHFRDQVRFPAVVPEPAGGPITLRPICLDVRLDSESNGGKLQELDCWGVPGEHLYLNAVQDGSNFYTISTLSAQGRLLVPRSDIQGGSSEILGLGPNQVLPAACGYRQAKKLWALQEDGFNPNVYYIVNAATGTCIQIDGSNIAPEGDVNMLDCFGKPEEEWTFVPWGSPVPHKRQDAKAQTPRNSGQQQRRN